MTTEEQETTETNSGAEEAAEQAESDEPSPLEEELKAARDDLAKAKEKLLRTAADFDNFRKRTAREVDDVRRRGKQSAVKDLLPVFDSMDRALAHTDDQTDAKSMADGFKLVFKQFLSSLGKMNIERIEAIGTPFDPTFHDSIQYEASDEYEAGIVMGEMQAGYRMGDELLRPAMVVVSRGPEQPAPVEEPEVETEASEASEASDTHDSAGSDRSE